MNYIYIPGICGYLLLQFKDGHEICQINPSQTLMNLQYNFIYCFMFTYFFLYDFLLWLVPRQEVSPALISRRPDLEVLWSCLGHFQQAAMNTREKTATLKISSNFIDTVTPAFLRLQPDKRT